MSLSVGAMLGSTVDTCSASVLLVALDVFRFFSSLRRTRILKCFSPFCSRAEKRARSTLLVAVLLCAVRTWKPESTLHELHVAVGTCVSHRCQGAGSTRESDSGLADTHAN